MLIFHGYHYPDFTVSPEHNSIMKDATAMIITLACLNKILHGK